AALKTILNYGSRVATCKAATRQPPALLDNRKRPRRLHLPLPYRAGVNLPLAVRPGLHAPGSTNKSAPPLGNRLRLIILLLIILLRKSPLARNSMQRVKLDLIDRKILADLQADGRMTNVELAQRVGISAPPCLRRVRALEEAGYIKGYHAELNPQLLGYGVTVFAMVGLNSQAEHDLVAFEQTVANWPQVRECYMLAGENDFILKIVARDWDAYQ